MFLDQIVSVKQKEVNELKQQLTVAAAEAVIADMPACLGFEQALSAKHRKREVGLIAEVKKASPSKGLIRADFNPVSLAKDYEAAGADCISVLTDQPFFQGANEYLSEVRQAVQIPLLRKDFTIDALQIWEARMIGADAILLIAAILSTEQMSEFIRIARNLGLDVLVEVHDREELERVLELDVSIIGINNRNLKTFVTSLETTEQLIPLIPKGITIVSESGISQASEIHSLQRMGTGAVLVGEHFMRQPSVVKAVQELMGPVQDTEG